RMRESLESAWRTVRHALRGLRRAPGFVATAVTCMALGVGANAAAFSLFDELILRPLPVHEPERLVNLGAPGPRTGSDSCNQAGSCEEVFSYPMFRDLERAQTVFTGIAAHRLFLANVIYGERTMAGEGVFVSGAYFPVLGVRPALGRLLGPSDDRIAGGHSVAVLSHAYWMTELGSDPGVFGRQIVVNDRSLTIVGVAPPGFDGTTLGVRPTVYVPMMMTADVDPFFGSRADLEDRSHYWLYLFARRASGVSLERARAAMNAVYRPILADVEAPLQRGMSAQRMARFLAREVAVEDGRHGQSTLRDTTRTPLLFLFGVTGLVVLIACANIANLLLARGAGRVTEMAVRLSLGAGRRQLVAQLLVESSLLAVLGGAASIVVAYGTLALVGALIPPASLTSATALSLDVRAPALAFAAIVSLGTGLLFGLFPALHATRPDLITAIRSGAGQIAGGNRAAARFRTTLVTAQIALSMALLASAGLFIKSLRNVGRVDLGLDVERVVTFGLLPELSGYDRARSRALFERVEEEVAGLPGVTSAAASAVPLFTGSSRGTSVRVEGFARGPDTDSETRINTVGPGFFRTLRIPIMAGREFTPADRMGTPRVAVVNEAFARKFGLDRDVVGKRVGQGGDASSSVLDIEIVGVARDASYSGVKGEPPPVLFTPYRQDSIIGAMVFYARTSLPPEQLLRSVPGTIARLDAQLPVALLRTMRQQVRENTYLDRMLGALSAGFAGLATLLAAVGLYGVLSYTVAQRSREIGVRMALGAHGRRIRGMVLWQVARMTLVGGVIGVAAALGIGRAAQSLLFGLEGNDLGVVAAAAVMLAAVALAAGYLPAWRAARVSPVEVLRRE
ncbi:MAG TPA: ABC transporter permease, partial [Gemmatimonadaceae bacterium]|nr:ABC transporter permease [Gemmatimonadaceae bacterium]